MKTKRLNVSHAFHSHQLDPILDEFADAIGGLAFHAPRIPIVSNLTGHLADTGELADPGYWRAHIRGTVRFADGIRTLRDAGVSRYLELGPDPVLAGMARETLAEHTSAAVSTLRNGQAEVRTLLRTLGIMHVTGAVVDWTPLLNGGRRAALPTYAFSAAGTGSAKRTRPDSLRSRHPATTMMACSTWCSGISQLSWDTTGSTSRRPSRTSG